MDQMTDITEKARALALTLAYEEAIKAKRKEIKIVSRLIRQSEQLSDEALARHSIRRHRLDKIELRRDLKELQRLALESSS